MNGYLEAIALDLGVNHSVGLLAGAYQAAQRRGPNVREREAAYVFGAVLRRLTHEGGGAIVEVWT